MEPSATIVMADTAPALPKPVPRAALARLAFGSVPRSIAAQSLGPRHLAFLPPEALAPDLVPARNHGRRAAGPLTQ